MKNKVDTDGRLFYKKKPISEDNFSEEYLNREYDKLSQGNTLFYFLQPYLTKNERHILDNGSGFGFDLLFLREKMPETHHVGVEISKKQIHVADKFIRQKRRTNIDLISGDGTTLPIKDNSFDIVISNQVIEHIQAKEGYVQETHRILKKGGIFLISTGNRIFPYEEHLNLPFIPWLPKKIAVAILERAIPGRKGRYYRNVYPLTSFHLEKLLKKAGFEVEYVTPEIITQRGLAMFPPKSRQRRFGIYLAPFIRNRVTRPFFYALLKCFGGSMTFIAKK